MGSEGLSLDQVTRALANFFGFGSDDDGNSTANLNQVNFSGDVFPADNLTLLLDNMTNYHGDLSAEVFSAEELKTFIVGLVSIAAQVSEAQFPVPEARSNSCSRPMGFLARVN